MIAAGRRFRIVWFFNGACFIHTLLIQLESSVCFQPWRIAAANFTVCILHVLNVICKINASMTTSTENQKKAGFGKVAWFLHVRMVYTMKRASDWKQDPDKRTIEVTTLINNSVWTCWDLQRLWYIITYHPWKVDRCTCHNERLNWWG